MIIWNENLAVSIGMEKKYKKAKRAIEKRKPTMGVFCVAVASNPENLFDIYSANELLFPYYKKRTIKILGLAESNQAAQELVADMLELVLLKTGTADVREYYGM